MAETSSTVQRQWATLRLIPRHPRELTTVAIFERLRDSGYGVNKRTVERDLLALEGQFALLCRSEGRTHYWSWDPKTGVMEVPGMSAEAALCFLLARDYLKPLLPSSVLDELASYFGRAQKVLATTKLGAWRSCVRLIQRGPSLLAPVIAPTVRDAVFTALLERQVIDVDYKSRQSEEARRLTLNPLGLVAREGVLYLVATAWDYDDARHYGLHRMSNVQPRHEGSKSPKGFSLAEYLEVEQSFGYPLSAKTIRLEALFSPESSKHLEERPLATEQRAVRRQDGRVRITAPVLDTSELRWWLLGFGNQVEVLRPARLRKEIRDVAFKMAAAYSLK